MATLNEILNTNSTSGLYSSETIENPGSVLDNDAFFKLFLTELQNQDPTEPMDSDKILTQTSMMTELEAQEEMKDAMESISAAFQSSQQNMVQFNAVSMIDKVATTDLTEINLEEQLEGDETVDFNLYFDMPIDSGTIQIIDADNDIVQSYPLDEFHGQYQNVAFEWNGKNDDGNTVPAGKYTVVAKYLGMDGENYETTLGRGKVEGVKFEDGVSLLKIGSSYIPMENVLEFSNN